MIPMKIQGVPDFEEMRKLWDLRDRVLKLLRAVAINSECRATRERVFDLFVDIQSLSPKSDLTKEKQS